MKTEMNLLEFQNWEKDKLGMNIYLDFKKAKTNKPPIGRIIPMAVALARQLGEQQIVGVNSFKLSEEEIKMIQFLEEDFKNSFGLVNSDFIFLNSQNYEQPEEEKLLNLHKEFFDKFGVTLEEFWELESNQ